MAAVVESDLTAEEWREEIEHALAGAQRMHQGLAAACEGYGNAVEDLREICEQAAKEHPEEFAAVLADAKGIENEVTDITEQVSSVDQPHIEGYDVIDGVLGASGSEEDEDEDADPFDEEDC